MSTPRLRVRRGAYRGREGYHVYGRYERWSFPVRIFTETASQARRIVTALKTGDEAAVDRILQERVS